MYNVKSQWNLKTTGFFALLDPDWDDANIDPLLHELRSTGKLEVLPMYRAEFQNDVHGESGRRGYVHRPLHG